MKKLLSVVLVICILVTSLCFVYAEEAAELMAYNSDMHTIRSLAPGKSLKITLVTGSVESITMFDKSMKFDVAVYFDDTVVETGNYCGQTEKFSVWRYYKYIILTARSENAGDMQFYYETDTLAFEECERDALTHYLLKPGESVKVTNLSVDFIDFEAENKNVDFDIITFGRDGSEQQEYHNPNKEVSLQNEGGYAIVTANAENEADVNLFCTKDALNFEKTSSVALKYINLEATKSIRAKNIHTSSTKLYPADENYLYDYVVYNSNGNVIDFPESNINGEIYIPYGGWCDITAKDKNVQFYYRSNHSVSISEKFADTLTYFEIQPGKSVIVDNNTNELIDVLLVEKDVYFDSMEYCDNGTVEISSANYNEKSSAKIRKNASIVITAKETNEKNAKFYYVNDLAKHWDYDKPALGYVTLNKGESARIYNTNKNDEIYAMKTVNNVARDYTSYNADGSFYNSGNQESNMINAIPAGGFGIVTSKDENPVTIYYPYEYGKSAAYSKSALTYITLQPGQTYTFKHNTATGNARKISSNDFVICNVEKYGANNSFVSSEERTTYFNVDKGGYAVVTVTGNAAKTFYYPYGSFNFSGSIFPVEISLDEYIPDLYVGDTYRIIPQKFGFAASLLKLKWSSSNPSVATVDENGLVTAVGEGEYTIYCAFDDGREEDSSSMQLMAYATSQAIARGNAFLLGDMSNPDVRKVFVETNTISIKNTNDEMLYSSLQKAPYKLYQKKFRKDDHKLLKNKYKDDDWGGACFGISVLSMLFITGYEDLDNYKFHIINRKNVSKVSQLNANSCKEFRLPQKQNPAISELLINPSVSKMVKTIIEELQGLQWSNHCAERLAVTYSAKNDIKKCLNKDKCIIVSIGDGDKNHALLGYGLVEEVESYKLYVQDSNEPLNSNLYLEVHKNNSITLNLPEWDSITECGYLSYDMVKKAVDSDENKVWSIMVPNIQIIELLSNEEDKCIVGVKKLSKVKNSSEDELLIENKLTYDNVLNAELLNHASLVGNEVKEPEYYYISIPLGTYTVTPAENEPLSIITGNMSTKIESSPGTKAEINLANNEVKIINESGEKASFTITTENESLMGNNIDTLVLSGSFDDEFTFDSSALAIDNVSDLKVGTVTSEVLSETVPDSENTYGGYTFASSNEDGVNKLSVNGVNESGTVSDISRLSVGERKVLSAPSANYNSGNYENAITVKLTSEEDAAIYYTLDGSEPTEENGILYSGDIMLISTTTLKTAAYKDGYINSQVETFGYTMPEIEKPIAVPEEDKFTNSQYVELLAGAGSDIYYTLDGKDPYFYGDLYTVPLCINKNIVLKAVSVNRGIVSDVLETNYTINHELDCEFINFPTNQNGEAITKENFASATEMNVVVNRYDDTVTDGKMIVAEFGKNKALLSIKIIDVSFDKETNYITVPWQAQSAKTDSLSIIIMEKDNMVKPLLKKMELF